MHARALVVAVALVSGPSLARAGGFAELVGGPSIPRGDDGHEALVETSPAVGVRGGGFYRLRLGPDRADLLLGLELGAAYTAFAEQDDGASLSRTRLLGGVRVGLDHGVATVFARAGAGLDRIHLDASDLLEQLCGDPTVDGLALEASAGLAWHRGRLQAGADAGIGVGFHGDDRPACQPLGGQEVVVDVLDNRTLDLDLRLFAGVRF